ncbi:putative uncharacterized protein DDB_G0285119 [Contarinia nasturtii]|uniref:putative uncharacterized protein DDB_G0285119 n=1 Tax=Contarinia nasturtii TaxID=265458 RepID=UPI0012D40A01|nr:putative uncharacterized protein DDB_G0285119 [Contarinia nasturtii]XP_031621394.1 putative uncharacterized protein DDB_G0285119 [Contarinia nasturtii]XP_031621479.1 putative uncharacterized protein DDB_G0285119 [Contarinia nasturtii]XP_031621558.1 putative uncharacterized protein DDB_G0285119 [Contarinia nasturtii]
MPCEACNTQFTVFKRKKSCTECRRLYCSNCLTKNKERILCKRCVIFTTRPLSKIELLKLKAKDLIFYLQSKHISTTGCVEKEELVNLVLIHVDNSNSFTPDSQQSQTSFSMGTDQSDDARSTPFDQIRNTCQNLFSTFTEKIAADFNFDFKQNQSDRSNVCEDQPRYSNSFRNVNSFNSNSSMSNNSTTSNNGYMKPQRPTTMQTSGVNQSSRRQSSNVFSNSNNNSTVIGGQHCHTSNSQSSPTITGNSSSASTPPSMLKSMSSDHSLSRIATTTAAGAAAAAAAATAANGSKSPQPSLSTASKSTKTKPTYVKIAKLSQVECCNDAGSGCECSDDELITKFRQSYADSLSPTALTVTDEKSQSTDNNKSDHLTTASSSSSSSSSSAKPTEHASDAALKEEASALESSDISSFEDLGAVGATNMANALSAPNDTDKWQIVNPTWNIDDTASTSSIITDDKNETANSSSNGCGSGTSYTTNLPNSITELPQANTNESENQRQTPHDEMTDITFPQQQHSATSTQQRSTTELRTKLEKTLKSRQTHRKITRRQSDGIVYTASTSNSNNRTGRFLDDVDDDDEDFSSTSEDASSHKRTQKSCRKCGKTKGDLKKYIARFRHQLETTTTCSETEIRQQLDAFLEFLENHSAMFDSKDDESNTELVQSPSQFVADAIELEEFDDDDYDDEAGIHVYGSNDDTNTTAHPPRQFFNLNTVEKKEELEDLSVKQLKEVLMLNRVDFKGCCEKSELLERVQRLWDDLQNCPAVDKLATVDLCKICMDAAIECVLLECGHMATCTNCGKVLSECPICRQYIVRVVRFFKA